MKHLITGGAGFLGTLIARELLKKGDSVRVIDPIDDPDMHPDIEYIQGSVLDRKTMQKALKDVNIVHHNAALVPLTKSGKGFWDANVIGSQIAAEEAVKAGVDAFIHMSSSALFGLPDDSPITNNTPTEPIEIYGRSKLEGEKRVIDICKKANLPLTVIRPRTILGEERLGIFKILFDWIIENRNIYIIGSGNHLFQFVHAIDLMSFYMLTIEKQTPGIYNVGCKDYSTLRHDLEELINYAGSTSKVVSLPQKLAIGALKTLDFLHLSPLAPWHYMTYHKEFHFDVQPLMDLGWKPKYSNIDMFKESFDWYKENKDAFNYNSKSTHRSAVKEGMLWLLKKLS